MFRYIRYTEINIPIIKRYLSYLYATNFLNQNIYVKEIPTLGRGGGGNNGG